MREGADESPRAGPVGRLRVGKWAVRHQRLTFSSTRSRLPSALCCATVTFTSQGIHFAALNMSVTREMRT